MSHPSCLTQLGDFPPWDKKRIEKGWIKGCQGPILAETSGLPWAEVHLTDPEKSRFRKTLHMLRAESVSHLGVEEKTVASCGLDT